MRPDSAGVSPAVTRSPRPAPTVAANCWPAWCPPLR